MDALDIDNSDPSTTNMHATTAAGHPMPAYRPTRKSRAFPALIIAGFLLVGALGAAAGALGYRAVMNKKPVTTTNTVQTENTTPAGPNAEAVVKAVKEKMKSPEVPTEVDETSGYMRTKTQDKYSAYMVPFYQPSGASFTTRPKVYYGFSTASSDQNIITADMKSVRQYLFEQGFTTSAPRFDGDSKLTASSDFQNAGTICTVAETNYPYATGGYQVQLGCADLSSYKDNANDLKPLYTLYADANADIAKQPGLILGSMRPKASRTNGYKTADIVTGNIFSPMGGSVALFYQTPDGNWHYFTNTQNIMACDSFSTPDLKKAYAGQACGDQTGGTTVVTVDTPKKK